MSDRYQRSYRGYLIDHHSPDPPVVTFDRLDAAEHEACLRLAHVDQVMQYCKDHWGNCYYPTQVGRQHPGLRGRDWVGEIQEICRRNDLEFIAYYSVGFDEGAVRAHPDWGLLDETGALVRTPGDGRQGKPWKWPWTCGATGYADFACAHLREIVERYHPDSLFLDIFGQPLCYCAACQAAFREQHGHPLPTGEEKDAHWRVLREWQRGLHLDFMRRLMAAIKKTDSAVSVSVNGGHTWHFPEVLELPDFTYAEPWAGNFVSAGFARGTGTFPQIGPGGLSQVYNPHKPPVYVVEQANIVAQGVRAFMFSGSQKPDGSLDQLEFLNIGAAYAEIEKFQDLLPGREAVMTVGALFSPNTLFWDNPDGKFTDCFAAPFVNPYREQFSGVINSLAHSKYPYEVVPEGRVTPELLASARAWVLGNHVCMADGTAEMLRDYVAGGGTLIAGHLSSLNNERGERRPDFALADVFGVSFQSLDETYAPNQYGSYLNRRPHTLWESLPDTLLALSPPLVRVAAAGEVLATHVLPACVLGEGSWVNWWSPPPAQDSGVPAVVHNRYGAGQCLWFGFDLFTMSQATTESFGLRPAFPYAREVLTRALEVLVPDPPLRLVTPTPRAVGVTYFRQGDSLLVHLLNHTVSPLLGDVVPVRPGWLVIREDFFPVRRARLVYPAAQDLPIRRDGPTATVELPELELHQILRLE